MENLNLKNLIEKNKKLGLIKSYEDFCKTPEAEKYALDEEDIKYYKEKIKMDKVIELNNGKTINLNLLYPKRESVYHIDEYDKEDDIYNEMLSNEDKIKYVIK